MAIEKTTILSPKPSTEEITLENSLRPQTLETYIGQSQLKENLSIAIAAAKKREEPLDHALFYGAPGLGKTTIASILAREMGVGIKITSAPALERPRDIAGILISLQEKDILFIDEIHRLNKVAEEILYPAMEDFSLDITIGKGRGAKIKRLPLKKFTLIGATTQIGSLSAPLRSRFGHLYRLNFYEPAELKVILEKNARILNIEITPDGALEVASRSRGTPRIANRLLKRVRDFAQVKGDGTITLEMVKQALALYAVDEKGLDPVDRKLLETIIQMYKGGPVGLDTLAASIGEDSTTLEEVYEPYLLQMGYLNRTPRGRMALPAAYKHLGLTYEPGGQGGFF